MFFNVFSQLRFGMALERRWGAMRFVVVYFVSGIGATIMSCLLRPLTLSVGASGAIMGLMGGYLVETLTTWHSTEPLTRKINLIQVVFVVCLTMILSAIPYVDASAHCEYFKWITFLTNLFIVGGFVVGILIGLALFSVECRMFWQHLYIASFW